MNHETAEKGKKKLTKERLLKRLRVCEEDLDEEVAHIRADELLVEYIDDEEITKAFDAIGKWYA